MLISRALLRGAATPPVQVVDPKKLAPMAVRPGSIHSSVSGGSMASNSTCMKIVRKVILKKKSSDGC